MAGRSTFEFPRGDEPYPHNSNPRITEMKFPEAFAELPGSYVPEEDFARQEDESSLPSEDEEAQEASSEDDATTLEGEEAGEKLVGYVLQEALED